MKKLFTLILAIILLAAGCAKVEDMYVRDRNLNGTEIVFSTHNSVTKAIVEGTTMVDTMGVYGYVVPGDYSNGGYLMKNAQYDEKGDAIGGSYYWPKSDNPNGIDFIFTAYSQYIDAPTWENDTLKLAVPVLTQSLIDNPDDFDDVLWAQTQYNHHQNGNVGAEHERVILNFKHALSWLQFRGEVINPNIKWVKVKQIGFGEFRDSIPGTPGTPYQPAVPAQYDTTDVWFNLKCNVNVDGSPTSTKASGSSSYVDNYQLPTELVTEIKSYYSVDGVVGTYNLGPLNKSNWHPGVDTNCGKKLRIVKDIPANYRLPVERTDGTVIVFFDALKYLKDNGYDVKPRNDGGKPDYWGQPVLDCYVNGTAYSLTFFDYSLSSVSVLDHTTSTNVNKNTLEYTVELVQEAQPEVPATPGTPTVPAHGSEGLYVDGFLCLPTKDTLTVTPLATYGTQKDTTLNYLSAQVDTLFTNDHEILGNVLVIPQEVPEYITIVFDICIANPSGDDVIFTDRKITRVINVNKDADGDADYVASWTASNKYIYNFRFDGDILDFSMLVSGWTLSGTDYHVWDYE